MTALTKIFTFRVVNLSLSSSSSLSLSLTHTDAHIYTLTVPPHKVFSPSSPLMLMMMMMLIAQIDPRKKILYMYLLHSVYSSFTAGSWATLFNVIKDHMYFPVYISRSGELVRQLYQNLRTGELNM